MDCDTTGIEPDLGLVKIKKLVGGGTMSIVNQTVPRALRRLGYTADAGRRRSSPTSTSTSRSSAPRTCGRAPARLRLLDGRQHHPLPGPHPDDGRGPAVHLAAPSPRRSTCPRRPRSRRSSSCTSRPGSSASRPSPSTGTTARSAQPLATAKKDGGRPGRPASRPRPTTPSWPSRWPSSSRPWQRQTDRRGQAADPRAAAPAAQVEHLRLPGGRLRGLRHRRRVRGRPSGRGVHEGVQAGLDPGRHHGRLRHLGQPRPPARRAAGDLRQASTPTCASSRPA